MGFFIAPDASPTLQTTHPWIESTLAANSLACASYRQLLYPCPKPHDGHHPKSKNNKGHRHHEKNADRIAQGKSTVQGALTSWTGHRVIAKRAHQNQGQKNNCDRAKHGWAKWFEAGWSKGTSFIDASIVPAPTCLANSIAETVCPACRAGLWRNLFRQPLNRLSIAKCAPPGPFRQKGLTLTPAADASSTSPGIQGCPGLADNGPFLQSLFRRSNRIQDSKSWHRETSSGSASESR